ncbi:hypothetical protein V7114_20745 [Neobacillus niacini]|uniref:hypothetical protein n=1 Tax=Neobacillus niacini TaxID=86668 RepID=UPI002FFDD636
MKIDVEEISDGSTYEIEFYKAEEVAELGEHARKEKLSLPHNFNLNNEKMKVKLVETADLVMKQKDFDSFVLFQTIHKEFLLTVVKE